MVQNSTMSSASVKRAEGTRCASQCATNVWPWLPESIVLRARVQSPCSLSFSAFVACSWRHAVPVAIAAGSGRQARRAAEDSERRAPPEQGAWLSAADRPSLAAFFLSFSLLPPPARCTDSPEPAGPRVLPTRIAAGRPAADQRRSSRRGEGREEGGAHTEGQSTQAGASDNGESNAPFMRPVCPVCVAQAGSGRPKGGRADQPCRVRDERER